MRFRTAAISVRALVALVSFAVLAAVAVLNGCESSSPGSAAVETPPVPVPQIIHQTNGEELLQLEAARVPGATFGEVREVELPSVLEANGQVTFDDRRVSSIVSRVAGRIEETAGFAMGQRAAGRADRRALQSRLHDRRGRVLGGANRPRI